MSNSTPDYDFYAPRGGSGDAPASTGTDPGRFGAPTQSRFGGAPATNQFGSAPATNQFGSPVNQFGAPSPAAPSAPAASGGVTIPPRLLLAAGGIVVTLILGFFGVGRFSFLAPDVKLPGTVDGLLRIDGARDLMAAGVSADNDLKEAIDAGDADIQMYGDEQNRMILVMAARRTESFAGAFPNAAPQGDGVCHSGEAEGKAVTICTSEQGSRAVAVFNVGPEVVDHAHLQQVAHDLREDVL